VNILIEEQRKYKIVKKHGGCGEGSPDQSCPIQHRTSELDEKNTRIKVGKNTRLA
jgi:hypothetical protein